MIIGNPISTGLSDAIYVLTIITAPGANISAVLDDQLMVKTADDSGVVVLRFRKEGTWTVTASDGTNTKSITVEVSSKKAETIVFFPAEPSAYTLIGTCYTPATWTAPEDGYYQIEIFGASGHCGETQVQGSSKSVKFAIGGGGGGGAYCCSKLIKLKAGDTAVIGGSLAVGGTVTATINSSFETYSVMSCVSGGNGTDGSDVAYGGVAGIGGSAGTASGGNYSNIAGNAGSAGITSGFNGKKENGATYTGGAGGAAVVSGGNAGGNAASVTVHMNLIDTTIMYNGAKSGATYGSAAFVKIYRGNTNVIDTDDGNYVDTVLGFNSWKTISEVSKAGKASEYWNIGDEKQFTLDGVTYTARIIGFDHDDVTDSASYGRSKAGITFEVKEIVGTSSLTVVQSYDYFWATGTGRLSQIPSRFTNLLDADMLSAIVKVNKAYATSYTGSSISYVSDDVFLLSEQEIFGAKTSARGPEGSQYAYYAAGNSKLKYMSGKIDPSAWTTRSIAFKSGGSPYVVIVSTAGAVASNKNGSYFSPAFCV